MPPSVRVILNPASSGGNAARLRGRVEAHLRARGIDFDLLLTRRPGHATDLAREAGEDGVDVVVAVGGDGTVHEVASGLLGTPVARPVPGDAGPALEGTNAHGMPALAVVPVGTGNDFYRMVGASREPEAALRVLEGGSRRFFDVGVVRWTGGSRYFVNLLGVGIDVEVLRRRAAFGRLRGLAQYLTALLVALVRYDPVPLRIRLDDGEEIRGPSHLASVTVGPSAGGGFLLSPEAVADDGLLDLCFVEGLTYPEIVRYLPRVVRGTHGDLDVVRLRTFSGARVERTDGLPLELELDGELLDESPAWIEVAVDPRRLPVLVPPSGSAP